MTCRDCRFLDVRPDAAGRRVLRKDHMFPCTVPVPEPDVPACMKYGDWPPRRSHMGRDDGADCKFYDQLKK